jgi:hypothetical protein
MRFAKPAANHTEEFRSTLEAPAPKMMSTGVTTSFRSQVVRAAHPAPDVKVMPALGTSL